LSTSFADDVLSNQDLFDGTILAVSLAFLFSFLQGRTPSSSNIKLWPSEESRINDEAARKIESRESNDGGFNLEMNDGSLLGNESDDRIEETKSSTKAVFDGDEWRDISKPENYLLYTSKIRKEQQLKQEKLPNSQGNIKNTDIKAFKKENRLVFFALLVLFVPIFSVEFFFALSRQFICGDFVTQVNDDMWLTNADRALSASNGLSPWARELCSPHMER